MRKQIVAVLLMICCLITGSSLWAEEQFRFSNWPLSDFSERKIIKPFIDQGSEKHLGIDIEAETGEEVKAVADGKVYLINSKPDGPNGLLIGIEHAENGPRTTYMHLSEILVKREQQVKASEVIGRAGTTGTGRDSQEEHLHFGYIADSSANVWDYKRRYDGGPLNRGPIVTNQELVNKEQAPQPEESSNPEQISPVMQPVPVLPIPTVSLPDPIPSRTVNLPEEQPIQPIQAISEAPKSLIRISQKPISDKASEQRNSFSKASLIWLIQAKNSLAKSSLQFNPQETTLIKEKVRKNNLVVKRKPFSSQDLVVKSLLIKSLLIFIALSIIWLLAKSETRLYNVVSAKFVNGLSAH